MNKNHLFKIFLIQFSLWILIISCSSDKEENEPVDKCKEAIYNPQTQFCFEGAVSDKGEFTDNRDNKKYRYVVIGSQTWMAEDLKFSDNGNIGRCYDDDPTNCDKYGRLYFWNTAIKVCPSGWHLPSENEWQILIDFAGGDEVAGKKLKARELWERDPISGEFSSGTDDYGFSALPNGYSGSEISVLEYPTALANLSYDVDMFFDFIGQLGHWWSSKEDDFISSIKFNMWSEYDVVSNGRDGKLNVSAVRCVKD